MKYLSKGLDEESEAIMRKMLFESLAISFGMFFVIIVIALCLGVEDTNIEAFQSFIATTFLAF